jgi:diguanylate cyclase (GGDEF)-like protein
MEREVKDLEAIIDLTQWILATLDPKELLFRMVTKISEIIPVTRCSVIKVDWLHRSAFVVASFEDPDISGIKLSLGKYPEIVEALKSKKPVVIKDVTKDPLMKKVLAIIGPLGIRSILVVPIFLRSKVIGTLFIRTSRTKHSFTSQEVRLLKALADASASVLHNAFLFEQIEDEKARLEKLAITDFLTGIFNVRYFYHRIIEEFSRCQRYDLPISCLMVDIDHFKRVNDVYGHKAGDMVLKEFAGKLKKHSRKSDVVARYGGEEFVILLPQTTTEGAVAEAERIRACVKKARFKSLDGKLGLTVSIGVSTYPHEKIKTHEDLIALADDALLRAKSRGRDKVVVYGK